MAKERSESGFTLIELMTVIFIVGILAAVAIPLMRGRVDSAKWSEARATAGSIRNEARAYCAEKGESYNYAGTSIGDLGFYVEPGADNDDLDGKYFTDNCYSIIFNGFNDYIINVDATVSLKDGAPTTPLTGAMDADGTWH